MILLINPQSAKRKFRLPLSLLAIAGSVEGKYEVCLLDGNFDRPLERIVAETIRAKSIKYVGITVMPGPQLLQAVPLTRMLRKDFPEVKIIWGGYFPSQHTNTVLESGLVDYVIRGQGDVAFPLLIDALEHQQSVDGILSVSYCDGDAVINNPRGPVLDPNTLPPTPYHLVDVQRYISKSNIGERTSVCQSSVGCPFVCGFCAVAGEYNGRWLAKDADALVDELLWQKEHWNIDSVMFYDNNFLVSEKRANQFSKRMAGQKIAWWAWARPDTVMTFSDATLEALRDSGCHSLFFGAESSSQELLDAMDKGGTQTPDTVLELCARMKKYGIVPELSFVLGNPSNTIDEDIERDLRFIRKCKEINAKTEIIIYIYSPVFFDDAPMFQDALKRGFHFPKTLDEWVSPQWADFDQRKNPMTPWLQPHHVDRIKGFEAVLDAAYPTACDERLTQWQRGLLKALGGWRYQLQFYNAPYEIKVAKRLVRYMQPQSEGY